MQAEERNSVNLVIGSRADPCLIHSRKQPCGLFHVFYISTQAGGAC